MKAIQPVWFALLTLVLTFAMAAFAQTPLSLDPTATSEYFQLGPYNFSLSIPQDSDPCQGAEESLQNLLEQAGSIRYGLAAPTDNLLALRSQVMSKFNHYVRCLTRSSKADPLILRQSIPWILMRSDLLVSSKDNLPPKSSFNEILVPSVMTTEDREYANSPGREVVSPEGVLIGTIFAKDPIPENKEGNKTQKDSVDVYDVEEGRLPFTRIFESLLSDNLSPNLDVVVAINSDHPDLLAASTDREQTIVDKGAARSATWKFEPHLPRRFYPDTYQMVTLSGSGAQYVSGHHNHPIRPYVIEIPNSSFYLHRRCIWGVILDSAKEFLTSLPGWIALISTATLAVMGYLRIFKRKNEATGKTA